MKLWHLLIAICFAMPIGGASGPANAAKAGIGGYVVAVTVGVVVGACCSWAMWRMHKAAVPHLLRRADERQPMSEWYFRSFYFSKVLWIAFALFLGIWLSSLAIRLVS